MSQSNLNRVEQAVALLSGDVSWCDQSLHLDLSGCRIHLRSNSSRLIEQLRGYFGHVLTGPGPADMEVLAVDGPAPDLGIEFTDWAREPGKSGRKDSYYDLQDGRLVRKVRTGMVFLQSEDARIAAGPCCEYDNQVINFVNAQYMNWLQQRNWHICHAAGLVWQGKTLGMAGFSGGGKSTLMLRLLDNPAVNYLTNDRLFIRRGDQQVDAIGIPKLPRVNPGTIVHNPALHGLIPEQRRRELLALPEAELWHLEEKYDVLVDQVYGANRITPAAPLAAFLVLNWDRQSAESVHLEQVDLGQRPELLGAIMKSPGPFYQYRDGGFFMDNIELDPQPYLDILAGIPVYEVKGSVDFDALTPRCLEVLS